MGKKSLNGAIHDIRELHDILRNGKNDLSAIWKAGEWLNQHFNKEHAERGAVARVVTALKRIEGVAPVSVNHLHKCRQFRLLWTKAEIDSANRIGLSWRRALQLTVIKSYAERLREKNPARRAQIRRDCKQLIASFSGLGHGNSSASILSARKRRGIYTSWTMEVEKLKRVCQANNPGASNLKKRLMVSCWEATVFKLNGAAKQIEKMRMFLPKKQVKYADAALRCVNAALKPLNRIYKRKTGATTKP